MSQPACKTPSADCVAVGEWNVSVSLGAGVRSNPVRDKSDIPLVVVPQISYYGKRFFLENLELGFTLHEDATNTFNLIATPGYDRVFFVRNDLQNVFVGGINGNSFAISPQKAPLEAEVFPVRSRHTTYLAGPEWIFNSGRFTGQLDALREVTGEHDGYEVRAALAAVIIQPQSRGPQAEGRSSSGKGSLDASAGFTWKSARTVNYYYGVDGLYEPGAAFNPFIRLGYSRPVSDRWTFTAFAHYEYLDNAIADSPIVAEHGVTTVFAGFTFDIL